MKEDITNESIKINLYNCMTQLIGMTADVIVVQWDRRDGESKRKVIARHKSQNNVKDDLKQELYQREVRCITVSNDYPGKIVIWVEDSCKNSK